jgi:hypothetical protein
MPIPTDQFEGISSCGNGMNNPLRTPDDYELFVYTIPGKYPKIIRSTVSFIRIGMTLARLAGEIEFETGYRLVIRERLVYTRLPAVIDWYGYEVWKGAEKLYWYDSQPHPDDMSLQSTYPHHKHIHPGIKHHRMPAPGMSFVAPNLPILITEVIELINEVKY